MTDGRDVRVVVTGIGAVSVWGWDAAALWRGLASGRTGIAAAERFDTRGQRTEVAGEVPAADGQTAAAWSGWRLCSRADRFAVVAAAEAYRQASSHLDPPSGTPDAGLGVFFGGSTAGMAECESFLEQLHGSSPRPRWSRLASHQLNCPGDTVARQLGACGPVWSVSSACASGALAIGAALDALRDGEAEAVLAGGADSLCRLTYSGFNSLRAVASSPCRPFRSDRSGMSLGEGAGVLHLETLEGARRRGVRPLAELLGAGASCDAHHMTAPRPDGEGAAQAIERALRDAAVTAGEVDFVNAHGTGTPHNDAAESRALRSVFGDRVARLPVTSTKASVGHLLGSSGALEAVATVQCLLAGEVHPVPGRDGDDDADDDLGIDLVVGRRRPLEPLVCPPPGEPPHCPPPGEPPHCPPPGEPGGRRLAVSTSFGFGGANAVVVLRGWPEVSS